MKLVSPRVADKDRIIKCVDLLVNDNQNFPFDVNIIRNNFDKFVKINKDNANGVNLPEGWVPGEIFMIKVNDEYIGRIALRYKLNENLELYGGHIGYGICPKFKSKGHATKALELALNIYRKRGDKKVLITCDDDNVGSKKVILNNGGVLDNTIEYYEGMKTCRYWILL